MLTIPLCLKQPNSLLFHGSAMLVRRQGNWREQTEQKSTVKILDKEINVELTVYKETKFKAHSIRQYVTSKLNIIVPFKEIRNQGKFACGIRNSWLWNPKLKYTSSRGTQRLFLENICSEDD